MFEACTAVALASVPHCKFTLDIWWLRYVCSKGAGSACLLKPQRMEQIVRTMSAQLSCPLTFKMRKVRYKGSWSLGVSTASMCAPALRNCIVVTSAMKLRS